MSVFKLPGTAIQANTITTTQLTTTVVNQISAGGGPRVSSLIYPGNDTAGNTVGGQTVYINGSGFETNNTIYINGNAVPSKSFISASNLSFTTPALAAGIYPVYVINTDSGATAIFIPGYISSAEPTWVTGSSLSEIGAAEAWSYSLSATGDAPVTYALAAGSSLPSGISLAANGLISGTLSSPPANQTQYTFTVVASDAQNQDASRQFTVSVSTGEGLLFANNVLLIHSDGTNNQNNHTFLDSSNNNFTITRNGNATQGSFSPFSQTGWSVYFDGDGDFLDAGYNSNFTFGSGNFTIECWIHTLATGTIAGIWDDVSTNPQSWIISSANRGSTTAANINFVIDVAGADTLLMSALQPMNKWFHLAVSRSGSSWYMFMDGVQVATATSSATISAGDGSRGLNLGGYNGANQSHKWGMHGYISNFRINKGTALYTSAFTPANSALTAVSGTTLLTCQSNRFIDNSSNNYGLTRNGNISIQAFSPFAPTAAYSTANVGGSGYFDGSGDWLSFGAQSAFDCGTSTDFCMEAWVYRSSTEAIHIWSAHQGGVGDGFYFTTVGFNVYSGGGGGAGVTSLSKAVPAYAWSHVVLTRQNDRLRYFLNGELIGTSTSSVQVNTDGRAVGINGGVNFTGDAGYIAGSRFIKGAVPIAYNTAVTTTNTQIFIPPSAPVTTTSQNANSSQVIALVNYTNAGIFDQTAKNVLETVGDAKVSTAQYKYGTGSMVFDGSGDRLTIPYTNSFLDLGINGEKFTIEAWIYPTNAMASTGQILSKGGGAASWSTTNGAQYQWGIQNSAAFWSWNSSGSSIQITNGNVTLNTWQHLAVTYDGTTTRTFLNGVQQETSTSGYTAPTTRNLQYIGMTQSGGYTQEYYGYIDDLRITKGYARYTSNFTAPTSALKDK